MSKETLALIVTLIAKGQAKIIKRGRKIKIIGSV